MVRISLNASYIDHNLCKMHLVSGQLYLTFADCWIKHSYSLCYE